MRSLFLVQDHNPELLIPEIHKMPEIYDNFLICNDPQELFGTVISTFRIAKHLITDHVNQDQRLHTTGQLQLRNSAKPYIQHIKTLF